MINLYTHINLCRVGMGRVCLPHELEYAARKECATNDIMARQLPMNTLMDID